MNVYVVLMDLPNMKDKAHTHAACGGVFTSEKEAEFARRMNAVNGVRTRIVCERVIGWREPRNED